MNARRIGDYCVYLLLRVVICWIQSLRIESCAQLARWFAWLAYDVVRLRRGVIDDNLAHALPDVSPAERSDLGRAMWEHLVLMGCEIAHSPRKVHETNWREFVEIRGKRELVSLLLDLRPTVIVTGHFGNFEFAGYVTGVLGIPTFTVARTLDNPYLDAFLKRFREAKLQFMLPKQGSAPQANAVLEGGGSLVLLGDQNAGQRGCWVDFLNRPASCHKALALFTLLSQAPMMVCACRRAGRPMRFILELVGVADPARPGPEQADARTLSQWYMDCLAGAVRRAPGQYWWVHRLWKELPPEKARRVRRAAA